MTSYHFDCMPGEMKKELVKKLEADHIAAYPLPPLSPDSPPRTRPQRRRIEMETLGHISIEMCPSCKRKGGSRCHVCRVSGVQPTLNPEAMVVDGEEVVVEISALMIRCKK